LESPVLGVGEEVEGKDRWSGARLRRVEEKHEGLETELKDLKGCIIQEHINGF